MKQLLQLNNDFIIQTEFNAELNKDKKPIWTDVSKTTAMGRNEVTQIEMLVPIYDSNGYQTDQFRKIEVPKNDVLKLAEKIKEIEREKVQGVYSKEFPF